jgi:hypothetical protein
LEHLEEHFKQDIAAIGRIPIVPYILETICRTTGLGFSAVARVTPERWIACAVEDKIQFGLLPGGELKVDSTICHEIRQSGEGVIIDHVEKDDFYRSHHTPLQYGFQSYISLPIFLKNKSFFGTLCGIDPHPGLLNNPEIIGMFKAYSKLIAFHLDEPGVDGLYTRTREVLKRQLISLTGYGFEEDSSGNHIVPNIVDRKSTEYEEIVAAANTKISQLLEELKSATV